MVPRVVHADCGKTIVGRNDSDAVVAELTRDRRTEACYYLDHLNTCHGFFNLLAGAAIILWIVGCDEVRWVQAEWLGFEHNHVIVLHLTRPNLSIKHRSIVASYTSTVPCICRAMFHTASREVTLFGELSYPMILTVPNPAFTLSLGCRKNEDTDTL